MALNTYGTEYMWHWIMWHWIHMALNTYGTEYMWHWIHVALNTCGTEYIWHWVQPIWTRVYLQCLWKFLTNCQPRNNETVYDLNHPIELFKQNFYRSDEYCTSEDTSLEANLQEQFAVSLRKYSCIRLETSLCWITANCKCEIRRQNQQYIECLLCYKAPTFNGGSTNAARYISTNRAKTDDQKWKCYKRKHLAFQVLTS
jgi:hypothetical protein